MPIRLALLVALMIFQQGCFVFPVVDCPELATATREHSGPGLNMQRQHVAYLKCQRR